MNEIHPERGTKRTCQSCSARFYDLARTPIVCPKCGADYVEIVRAEPVRYQRRKRGLFGPNDPSVPLPDEENEVPVSEEEGERELDGEADPEAEIEDAEE